jgi:hypothetical protein
MTIPLTTTSAPPRSFPQHGRNCLGIVAVYVLSLGTDQVLHMLKVYPPWGQPMYDTSLNRSRCLSDSTTFCSSPPDWHLADASCGVRYGCTEHGRDRRVS